MTLALPRLLRTLRELELTATFCVEALNFELNPVAVEAIVDAGHELALHGWRHEVWSELAPAREDELLERCRTAAASAGHIPRGFRPPGGELPDGSPERLAAHGFTWCSPLHGTDIDAGIATVPFVWEGVDALWRLDRFAARREERGQPPAPLPPPAARRALLGHLVERSSAAATLILHPFLMCDDAWWGEVRGLLGRLATARTGGSPLEILTAGTAAERGIVPEA